MPRPASPQAGAGPAVGVGAMFLTTRRYPIHYLPITKCGSTYLKNLLWMLDHDAPHPDPLHIHAEPGLIRAGDLDAAVLAESPFRFAVLRDPVDRFLSFYFDKIARDGPAGLGQLRRRIIAEAGLDPAPDLPPAGHLANAAALLGWLERHLPGQGEGRVNPHWRPQAARLRRAAAVAPEILTLDGLDWQLPAFLGAAIPDIATRMQAVPGRNAAPRIDIRDPALAERVEALYPRDAALVRRARARWAARRARGWVNRPRRPGRGRPALVLTAAHRAPLMFVPVPKAGCTLLRNLCYLIDHGRPHPDPARIHGDVPLPRLRITADSHGGLAFVMLRDPLARFLSLYFDKVIGTGPGSFPWIAEGLARRGGFHAGPDLTVAQHRENLHRLADFIDWQLRSIPAGRINGHWRPQVAFVARGRGVGLRGLTLEGVATQLPAHLGAAIPGIADLLARLGRPNATGSARRGAMVVDAALETRIASLYAADLDLHRRVSAAWAAEGRAPVL
ncbi:MAG: hypothetical protein KatS3mg118_0469 [Paracoccaceae bacterium]|nr:MAG: hypothetical protein KatS3mg118_0469 [Paracoccaceae bacterium]